MQQSFKRLGEMFTLHDNPCRVMTLNEHSNSKENAEQSSLLWRNKPGILIFFLLQVIGM